MRKPRYNDCLDDNDEFDAECYEEAMGRYSDEQRDEFLERMWDEGDQIHEQRKSEKDEKDDN